MAASLKYLQNSNDPDYAEFKICEPTLTFVKIFNNIYDICNSKSKFGRNFKRPIDKDTCQEYFDYMDYAIEYIKK